MGRIDEALYEFRASYVPRNKSFDRIILYETVVKLLESAQQSSEEHAREAMKIVTEIDKRDNTEVIQETLEERLLTPISVHELDDPKQMSRKTRRENRRSSR